MRHPRVITYQVIYYDLSIIFCPVRCYIGAPMDPIVCHTQAYILHLLGGFLPRDKLGARVHLRWLSLLNDFHYVRSFSWRLEVQNCNLCHAANCRVSDIARCLALLQSWICYKILEFSPPCSYELTFTLVAR